MFGALTKLADKPFIIGFFLPALLFFVCLFGTAPATSSIALVSGDIFDAKKLENLTLFVLAVWCFSLLLLAGNYWMYRALEGYKGPFNLSFMRKRAMDACIREGNRVVGLKGTWKAAATAAVGKTKGSPEQIAEHRAHIDYLNALLLLRKRYPKDRAHVLPTRFGNVIVAFETYPVNVYGVESIFIWPRLQAVVPTEFLANLTDAKSQVDFFVNVIYLCGALFLWFAFQFCAFLTADVVRYSAIGEMVAMIVIVRIAYFFAVQSAMSWGEVVKSTFDLYLPALAKQLGFELPPNRVGRRAFWDAFSSQFQYQDPARIEQFQPARPDEEQAEQKPKPAVDAGDPGADGRAVAEPAEPAETTRKDSIIKEPDLSVAWRSENV